MKILNIINSEIEILKKIEFFNIISTKMFSLFLKEGMFLKNKRNYRVFSQGDKAQFIYFLLRGNISAFLENLDGKHISIDLPSNTLFGQTSLINHAYYPYSVETLEDCTLFKVHRDIFNLSLKEEKVASYLISMLTNLVHEHISMIGRSEFLSKAERLGCHLLRLSMNFNRKEIPFNKKIVAASLNMAPETLSRASNILKNLGTEIINKNIIIKDSQALKEFCCKNCSKVSSPQYTECVFRRKTDDNLSTTDAITCH